MQLTVIDGGRSPHETRPEPDSVRSERTGGFASLLDVAAYPLLASCAGCEEPIRCDRLMMADWQHVDPAVPPAADSARGLGREVIGGWVDEVAAWEDQ